jgi:outer membrane protein
MNQTLQTYQNQLAKQLQIKEDYARSKLTEYQAYMQEHPNATPESDPQVRSMQEELQKLDNEIRQEAANSEEKLMTKRQKLLEPVIEKLKTAIDKVALAEGYTYIFNSVDGSGVSIILKGPEENDLTKRIMTELGIAIPEN